MDPITIAAGTQAAGRRFTFYVAVQMASVLAPGVVVIAGSLIIARMFQNQASSQSALAVVREFSGAAGFVTSLLLLASGYVSGYVLREVFFKVLTQVEAFPWLRNKAEVGTFDIVEDYFSPDLLSECFRVHPVLGESYNRLKASKGEARKKGSDGTLPAVHPKRAGGGHMADLNYLSFLYSKLWVRNYAPGVSIDSMEAEINILVSGFAPSLLVGLAIIAAARSAWWAVVLGGALVVIVWSVLFNSAIRLRRDERQESVRNLVLDYAMRRAAGGYPVIQATGESDLNSA